MKYNTYEVCSLILRNAATRAAEAIEYTNWSDEFVRKEMIRFVCQIKEASWFEPVDPSLLTEEQMKVLMFNKWSDETNIMLIPLYLRQFLKEGITVKSISGEEHFFFRDSTDNDHRFGCLAYGVIPAVEAEPASE